MGSIADRLRGVQTARVASFGTLTTSITLGPTTDYTTTGGFDGRSSASAMFQIRVASNSSAAPKVFLDASDDNSTFTAYATLHSDLTTTANYKITAVSVLGQYHRVRPQHATTATKVKISVIGYLKP